MRTRRSQSSSDPVSEGPSIQTGHRSVLLHEALDALAVSANDTVVDATLGGGGHAREIARKLGKGGSFIGFDLDSDAVRRAEVALAGVAPKVQLVNANFRNLRSELAQRLPAQAGGIQKVDKIFFALGWSGYQLEVGRGFSF